MKQLSLLLYSILIISCKQNSQNQNMLKSDIRSNALELINNGFLKYADSSKVDSLETQLKNSFDIYDDDNFKIAHIDAEELAEFSFDFFVPRINRILAKRNLKLTAKKLNDQDNSFDILINEESLQLYSQADLDKNSFWNTASGNFFRKVNEILKAKNIEEQFYLLYEGNDLHAILLTEKQHSIIADYHQRKPKEIPYKP